jgi:hypothetical protein
VFGQEKSKTKIKQQSSKNGQAKPLSSPCPISLVYFPRDVKLFLQILLPRRPGASRPKIIGPPIPTSAHNVSFSTHLVTWSVSICFQRQKTKIKMMHVFNKTLVMSFKVNYQKNKLFENQNECMYLIK